MKLNKKSLFPVLGVLTAASMFLAACGTPTPAPATEVPATEVPAATEAPATEVPAATVEPMPEGLSGSVSLWHAYQAGSSEETALTNIIAGITEKNPGLTIDVLQVPFDQIFNKYQTEVAAGGGPDMFVAPNDDLGNWVRGELVADLTAALDGKLEHTAQVAIDGMTVDGMIYGVPESAKAVALYYNKSLVETAPATTDELLAAIEGGAPATFFVGAYHMFGWSGSFGGSLLDANGACVADQGGWVEAMDYLLALKEAGATMTGDYGQAEAPFRAGETAFFVNGPWALADYQKDLGDNLGVAVMPAGPGGNASPLNGIDGFYVNPNAADMDLAVAVALELTNQENSQIYTDEAGHVPVRDDVSSASELVNAFAAASASGFPRPQSQAFGSYWGPFGDMFTKVIEGEATSADGVAEACAAMNEANGTSAEGGNMVAELPANAEGTISLWHAYQAGSSEEAALTNIIAWVQEQNPGLTVDVLQVPFDQIFNKYQTEVAAGGGPDLFVAPNDDLGNWVRGELVADLTAALDGKLGHTAQVAVDGMTVDGAIYGVPESAKAVALYYNKSLVETAPATTDELLAAIEGGTPATFFVGAYHMFGWSGSFGGQLLGEDGTCVADQGGWVEALDYLLALKEAGATMTGDYGQAEAPFRAGETAFFVNGPWALADYQKDLGDNLGVAVMPAGPGGNASPLNGIDGFYVNPNTADLDLAVTFALWMTSQPASQIYTDEAGHVPVRDDVSSSSELVNAFAAASASGFPRPQSSEFGSFWGPFGDMFTKVIEGEATSADGVAEACTAMNEATGK